MNSPFTPVYEVEVGSQEVEVGVRGCRWELRGGRGSQEGVRRWWWESGGVGGSQEVVEGVRR